MKRGRLKAVSHLCNAIFLHTHMVPGAVSLYGADTFIGTLISTHHDYVWFGAGLTNQAPSEPHI